MALNAQSKDCKDFESDALVDVGSADVLTVYPLPHATLAHGDSEASLVGRWIVYRRPSYQSERTHHRHQPKCFAGAASGRVL
jgi:hypothetical protein